MPTLEVRLGLTRVGWLEYFSEDEVYRFSFDRDWLADPRRPILGQIFEDLRPAEIVSSGSMPCWFHHLLPQGYLRRYLARKLNVDESEEFAILSAGGGDLPGDVVLAPAEDRIHRNKPQAPPSSTSSDAGDGFVLGMSLAGMQWKLSVREGDRGLVVPARGEAGQWIAKFHDPRFEGLPRLEYATMSLAKTCGVDVPEVRLADASAFVTLPQEIPIGDGSVFLIRRFDRDGDGRIHIEDFAQILDRPKQFDASYEELVAVLSNLMPQDLDQFLLRLVFCILIGNGDAHLKNWSARYHDRRTPRLSPAYDIVPTIVYLPRDDAALTIGGQRRFDAIELASFDSMARWTGQDTVTLRRKICDNVEQISAAWHENGNAVGFTPEQHTKISTHMERVRARWAT